MRGPVEEIGDGFDRGTSPAIDPAQTTVVEPQRGSQAVVQRPLVAATRGDREEAVRREPYS